MTRKRISTILVLALGLVVCPPKLARAVSMDKVITYQGQLIDTNNQADDLYDFQFKLFDDPNVTFGNGEVGRTLYVIGVDVIAGYFRAPLYFGDDPNIFNGDPRWLEIAVRPHDDSPLPPGKGEPIPGADIYIEQEPIEWDLKVTYLPKSVAEGSSEYTILSPRQAITPTPYAIYAQTAGGGLCSCDCDGTPNYIAKFTDTNDLGDSVIYETSGGNVGIGTEQPQKLLDIFSSDYTDLGIRLSTGLMGGTSWDIDNDTGVFKIIERATCGPEFLNNTRIAIVGNCIGSPYGGNVGVGTTSPIRKFHVEGQAYIKDSLGIRTPVGYPFETALQIGDLVDPDICKNSPVVSIRECGGACGGLYVYADRFWSGYFGGGDFIIDGGNVGIGTTAPVVPLDVRRSNPGANQVIASFSNPSDDPGSEVSIDLGLGTLLPTAWRLRGTDGALYVGNVAVLPPAVTVTSVGKVGIATTSPTEKLDVDGTARLRGLTASSGTTVVADGNGKLFKQSSSRRYKTNIQNFEGDADKVLELRPVRFRWTSTGQDDIGLIAEEVETVATDLVIYDQEGKADAVKYDKVSLYLLGVVKELKSENDSLKQRLNALEKRLDQMQPVIAKGVQQ